MPQTAPDLASTASLEGMFRGELQEQTIVLNLPGSTLGDGQCGEIHADTCSGRLFHCQTTANAVRFEVELADWQDRCKMAGGYKAALMRTGRGPRLNLRSQHDKPTRRFSILMTNIAEEQRQREAMYEAARRAVHIRPCSAQQAASNSLGEHWFYGDGAGEVTFKQTGTCVRLRARWKPNGTLYEGEGTLFGETLALQWRSGRKLGRRVMYVVQGNEMFVYGSTGAETFDDRLYRAEPEPLLRLAEGLIQRARVSMSNSNFEAARAQLTAATLLLGPGRRGSMGTKARLGKLSPKAAQIAARAKALEQGLVARSPSRPDFELGIVEVLLEAGRAARRKGDRELVFNCMAALRGAAQLEGVTPGMRVGLIMIAEKLNPDAPFIVRNAGAVASKNVETHRSLAERCSQHIASAELGVAREACRPAARS